MEGSANAPAAPRARLTLDQITSVLGRTDDATATAIIATGASIEELEEAAAWAAGESDVMGETEHRLAGAAAAVYDVLITPDKFADGSR